eukprot:GHVH01014106.1.p1 GENE.GHVH01014106.1~~GHVH01014106.1.p1  ORF type:complete len:575 (-),score=79.81 GHVH01014106.1:804-2279(-)
MRAIRPTLTEKHFPAGFLETFVKDHPALDEAFNISIILSDLYGLIGRRIFSAMLFEKSRSYLVKCEWLNKKPKGLKPFFPELSGKNSGMITPIPDDLKQVFYQDRENPTKQEEALVNYLQMSTVIDQETVNRLILDLNAGKCITIPDRYHLYRVLQMLLHLKLCEGKESFINGMANKLKRDLKKTSDYEDDEDEISVISEEDEVLDYEYENLCEVEEETNEEKPFTLAEQQLALQILFKLNVLWRRGRHSIGDLIAQSSEGEPPAKRPRLDECWSKEEVCERVLKDLESEFMESATCEAKHLSTIPLVLAQNGYSGGLQNVLRQNLKLGELYTIGRVQEIYDRHWNELPDASPSVSFLAEDGKLSKESHALVEKLISSISLRHELLTTMDEFKNKITGFFTSHCKEMFQCLQLFCKGFRGDEDETHFNLLVDKIDHDSRTEEEKRADEEELTRLRKKREKELVKLEGEKKKQTTKKERKEKAGGGTGPNKP